mgnify:CR=1 FL=1
MKRVIGVLMLAVLVSGCATSAFVERHNERAKTVHAMRAPNGDAAVGIDLADTGWWAAMKENFWGGLWALAKDTATAIGTGALVAVGINAVDDHGSKTENVTITAGGNVNYGTGTQTQTDRHDVSEAAKE